MSQIITIAHVDLGQFIGNIHSASTDILMSHGGNPGFSSGLAIALQLSARHYSPILKEISLLGWTWGGMMCVHVIGFLNNGLYR